MASSQKISIKLLENDQPDGVQINQPFQAAAPYSGSGDFSRRAKVTIQTIDGLARRCVGLSKVSNCFNLNVFCKSHAKNTEHTCELLFPLV